MLGLGVQELIISGLAVCAWLAGIIGGLCALAAAFGPNGDIYTAIAFIVIFGGGASLLHLLRRYIDNHWDSMGDTAKVFVTMPCLAIFAGALWFLFYVVIALLLVAALIYAFAGPHGAARDWARDAEPTNAELMAIRHKLEDINKKL